MRRFCQLTALRLLSHFVKPIPASAATVVNCTQISIDPTIEAKIPCIQLPGYPTNIGGANVDFYRYETNWDPSSSRSARHLQDIRTAADRVLPEYAKFATLPDIIFILQPTLPKLTEEGVAGIATSKPPGHTPCYVHIADDVSHPYGLTGLGIKRTTAHELYHCIQKRNHPAYKSLPPSFWWSEGSPGYFENSFYPNHLPSAAINRYRPSIHLYEQSYSASLFFEFLSSRGMSWRKIHEFVLRQVAAPTFQEARTSMANDPDIRRFFPLFAQAYKDGTIFFSDGVYASPPPEEDFKILEHSYTVRLTADGKRLPTPIFAEPFTMQSALVTLELGQTYVFSVSPLKEHAQLYYRGLSETAWKHFTSAVTIKVPCSGGINMYEFIFTSTGDRNTDGALLSVTRQSKQNCKCKRQDDESCPVDPAANSTGGFVLYPLLDPAASGAKCPPGTHGAINAPWCCPDGTELDQAVDFSICCPTSADCSKDIIPDNLRCADPSWVLWTKQFRQIGCCMQGYVPNSQRYCVQDSGKLGAGYSTIPEANAATPTGMATSDQ